MNLPTKKDKVNVKVGQKMKKILSASSKNYCAIYKITCNIEDCRNCNFLE